MKKHLILILLVLFAFKANAQDGRLNQSYVPQTNYDTNRAIARLSDGSVIVAGRFNNTVGTNLGVKKLKPDGSIDPNFNCTYFNDYQVTGHIFTICLLSDGDILVGGRFTTVTMYTQSIIRLNSNGSLDTGFASNLEPGYCIYDIEIQPGTNKILVGGSFLGVNDDYPLKLMYRLNTGGQIDTTFNTGGNGIYYDASGSFEVIYDIETYPNGDIIIIGEFMYYNGITRHNIAKLNADGTLNSTTFTPPGPTYLYQFRDAAIDNNGNIVAAATNNKIVRFFANGSVDTSFQTTISFFYPSGVNKVKVQTDNKIILAGSMQYTEDDEPVMGIMRVNEDGSLDTCFDSSIGIGTIPGIYDLIIEPDGNLIIAGAFDTYDNIARPGVAKLYANTTINATNDTGSIDQGVGGTAVSNVLANDTLNGSTASTANVTVSQVSSTSPGITINSSGAVYVASSVAVGTYTLTYKICEKLVGCVCDNAQVTITVNSTLTPGLRANNIVTHSALQSTGQIIIAGFFTAYNNIPVNRIARLNPDLTLDTSFNSSGPAPANQRPLDLAVLSDNRIIVVGQFSGFSGGSNGSCIAKLLPNGSIDTSFNSGQAGAGATDSNQQIVTVAVQPDGKILIGGYFHSYDGLARNSIARLLPNGFPDTSFVVGTGFNNYVSDILVQSDGKIVVIGNFNSYQGVAAPGIIRLNPNGSIDSAFLSAVGSGFSGGVPEAQTKYGQLQSDGKILLYGSFTAFNGVSRNNIARLNTNGSLDSSFNPGSGFNNRTRAIAVEPSGKIFVGGDFTTYSGTSVNTIVRLNTNGSLDNTFSSGTGPAGRVFNLTRQPDAKVIVGGQFTTYNGISATNITRIQPAIPGGQARGIDYYESEPEIDMSAIADIEGTNLSKKVSIYPNPSNGIFNLQVEGYDGQAFELEVFNTLGQLVLKSSLTGQSAYQIDLSTMETGNYFVRMQNNNTVINKIIAIKR